MTARLIMMRGVPRSGKSTRAKEIALKDGNTFIVSRDNLREMMLVGKWNGKKERVIIQAQEAIVRELLAREMNVIIDDTNLTKHHEDKWRDIAEKRECKFEVIEMDCVDPIELISRDIEDEENQRGTHVIMENLLQHNKINFKDKEIVVCDIDGTIANLEHRLHWINKEDGTKDWRMFFAHACYDKPIQEVIDKVKEEIKNGKQIIFVSGRSSNIRDITESWLEEVGFIQFAEDAHYIRIYNQEETTATPYVALLMRNENDRRDDDIVKQDILNKYLKKEWISKVYDDRPRVIVKTWIPELGEDRVVDCGNNESFINEREELNYWTK